MAAADKKKELNYDVILEGIIQAAESSEEAENQHLVLVLGQTGAGKTTAINALLQRQMKMNDVDEVESVEPSDFIIGDNASSQTSIAKVALCEDITAPGTMVAFADTPGFGENRSKEHDVVANGSIEMVLRRAKGVKAILIVIPWIHLLDARVPSIMTLLKDLVLIFKNPVDMARNAVFLINRCQSPPEKALHLLKHRLSKTKEHYIQLAREQHLSQPMDTQMYMAMAAFVAVMQENLSKFVFFNPLDDGQSVRKVFELINGIKTEKWGVVDGLKSMLGSNSNNEITVNDFSCSECNDNRKAFNDGVYHGVSDGNNILGCISSSIARCKEIQSEIPRCETQIAAWQELLVNLREKQQNPDSDIHSKKYLDDLQRRLAEITKDIEQVNLELKEVESDKQPKTEKLKELNVDEPIQYGSGERSGTVWWFLPWWYHSVHIVSSAPKGVEFVQEPEEYLCKGGWYDRVYKPKEGIYENTFKSDYGARGWYFRWATYIAKNKEPGNKKEIEKLSLEISELEKKFLRLTSNLKKLQEKAASFKEMIELEKVKEKCSKEKLLQRLKEAEANIATYETKIINLKAENDNCRNKGLRALQEFQKLQPKLDILAKIPKYLEFDSAYVKNFSSDYTKFVEQVSMYQSYLESVGFREDLALPEFKGCSNRQPADQPDVLPLDPITRQPIRDPVYTEAGTVFDEVSLIQQFDQTLSDPPPFMHRKEDGTMESIPFMSWRRLQLNMPTRRNSEDIKLNGFASSSVEELERQFQDLAKEIEALRDNLVIKDTLLKKIGMEIERKKMQAI